MNKLLKIIAIILLLLGMQKLDAQELTYKDKVYLKKGSVLIGAVSEYKPGESVTLKLENGSEMRFEEKQIKKVIMYAGKLPRAEKLVFPIKENKFFHEAQFSFLTNTDGVGYSISYNLLFQKNQRISFGAGVGLDNFYASVGREIYPIYANARYNLMESNSSPFLGMKLGYGMAFERESENIIDAEGGLMANPYFGIRLNSRGLIFNLFSGLKFQKADYVVRNSWETRTEDILHRRLEIGVSVMF